MEHLFKLKKDGKTVGYELTKYYSDGTYVLMHKLPKRAAFIKLLIIQLDGTAVTNLKKHFIVHDSKHFFVTKDKNGKDVFAGDTTNYGRLEWSPAEWAWAVIPDDEMKLGQLLYECATDIELIEEEND